MASIDQTAGDEAKELEGKHHEYEHDWNEIEGSEQALVPKIDHCQPVKPQSTKPDITESANALSITIALEHTNRKYLFQSSTEIEDINDNTFSELIGFVVQKYHITQDTEKVLLYEREEKSNSIIFVEDADDLQSFLEYNENGNDFKLFVQHKSLPQQKCCIVFIGSTASGKSSLIKLLSGNKNVKTSDGVHSDTANISLIPSTFDANTYFLDTVGTGDSKRTQNDAQILKMAFKYLSLNSLSNVKIIWCVKGDTTRKEAHFSQKAEFISKLEINNDDHDNAENNESTCTYTSVWNSCIIIKKEGGSKKDNIAGVIAAANDHGARSRKTIYNDKCFGFRCSDWNKYDELEYIPKDKQNELGYFSANQAKEAIENKLKEIASFKLWFKNEKCSKCGTEGDPRYIDARCHTKEELLHNTSLSFRHTGILTPYHLGNIGSKTIIKSKHTGYITKRHSGIIRKYHPGERKVSIASVAKTAVIIGALAPCMVAVIPSMVATSIVDAAAAATSKVVAAAVPAAVAVTNSKKTNTLLSYWWTCCNEYDKDGAECSERYECCQQDVSTTECSFINAAEVWSCCDKLSSNKIGCTPDNKNVEIWSCCAKEVSANGCRQKWNCCNGVGQGCEAYYKCCDGLSDSNGCCLKCSNCKTDWGTGPGCIAIND